MIYRETEVLLQRKNTIFLSFYVFFLSSSFALRDPLTTSCFAFSMYMRVSSSFALFLFLAPRRTFAIDNRDLKQGRRRRQ